MRLIDTEALGIGRCSKDIFLRHIVQVGMGC